MTSQKDRQRGITLLELMVVGVILLIVVAGLSKLIKQSFQGLSATDKVMVLQRDLLRAQDVIQRDFMSAGRSSFMNFLPDPGFESLATLPPAPTAESWGAVPVPMDPIVPDNNVSANITASTACFGASSLSIATFGVPYWVDSPVLSGLIDGQKYLVSGWILQKVGLPPLHQGTIEVLKNGGPLVSTGTTSTDWVRLSSTFTAQGGFNYSVRLKITYSGLTGRVATFFFDNVTLTPLGIVLTPGDMSFFEFQRRDEKSGEYSRLRYSLDAYQGSGLLTRQIWDGTAWQPLQPQVPNIRRLSVQWQNGEADTALGTDRPIDVVLEAGPVAGLGKTISTQFSISLGAP